MSRVERTDVIEAWLAEGPVMAPDRLLADLPARLSTTRQDHVIRVGRTSLFLAPVAAAAVILAVLVVTGVLGTSVGDDGPPDIPTPPMPLSEGDRVDVVLLVENRSGRQYGLWHWTGASGGGGYASPCHAIVWTYQIRAPGVVRFGAVEADEDPLARESLPVLLDTDALPGHPVAFRNELVPVWTYAYRVAVDEQDVVGVEPLDTVPSLTSAGPLCPPADTSWPGGWPDIQAWLRDRPGWPDCGLERIEASVTGSQPGPNTAARRCFYWAWLKGEDGQLVVLRFLDTGPIIEVMRTSGGLVEVVTQDLRTETPDRLRVSTCSRLAPPSEIGPIGPGTETAEMDATIVFSIDPESCSR
jgi:hypothetical protein